MRDLASLDLIVMDRGMGTHDLRSELRIASTNDFVAWFRTSIRESDGGDIINTNIQLANRRDLTSEQAMAAKQWLEEQMLAVV